MKFEQKILDTDVLVIGAGGAGIRAAIEAHEKGVKVIIVCKGKFPSGCTSIAMGAMQAPIDPNDHPDIYFEDVIEGGAFVNNRTLVRVLTTEAAERIRDLERFGTEFRKDNGNFVVLMRPGESMSRARVVSVLEPYGPAFIRGLVEEVRRRGIEVFERVMITKLLMSSGEVVGATGLNISTGFCLIFRSKSTILATGGAGQLYSLTTNPLDITGDGYPLAYRAGAELVDMEFVQSRPCIIHPQELRGTPPPADGMPGMGGKFYNVLGERYMEKYDTVRAEAVPRDLIAILARKEIEAGGGTARGGLYIDLTAVPEEVFKLFFLRFLEKCVAAGINPMKQPLEWAPCVHHFMGGVRINEKCETSVPSLYAAGEVVGGVHGANRIGGNALTETQVFGNRAGKFAAERVLSIEMPEVDEEQIEAEKDRIAQIFKREDGIDALEVREEIRKLMDKHVGVIRNSNGLREALRELDRIKREKLPKLCIKKGKTFEKLGKALEVINFIGVAEMVAKAALMRTESRGAHYRKDYPKRDDENWLKNIVIRFEANEMTLQAQPVQLIE